VQIPAGTLLIEATRRIGTESSVVMLLPRTVVQAACRMCLVEMEIPQAAKRVYRRRHRRHGRSHRYDQVRNARNVNAGIC